MTLSACKAIVIGKTTAQVGFLTSLARKCGFALIEEPATGEIPSPKALISFVLVHHKVGDELLGAVVRAIRSGDREVRFSPIVVIAEDGDFEVIVHFVHLGVDDVITLPEKRDVLVQRLSGQLWSEQVYVETESYFGPDRRRLEGAEVDERRVGMVGHARFIIQRVPDYGTKIVRHQIFTAPQAAPPMHRAG
jgi:hypothetical protein